MNLPEMPKPLVTYYDDIDKEEVHCYSAGQLQAYAEEAVRMEREACAAACESRAEAYRSTQAPGWHEVDHECTQCAAAIRARSQEEM